MVWLGLKVLLGAALIVGSAQLLFNTVPQGHRLKAETFALNTLSGILGVTLGSVFLAHAIFG
jgi:hypothetical protein